MRIRVACHVHSRWSYDGRYELDAVVKAFERRRYRIVMMAEHDVGFSETRWRAYRDACAVASTERLLLIPGIEYQDADNVVHIATWGAHLPFLGEGQASEQIVRAVRDRGGLSVLAHPTRRDASERFLGADPGLPDGYELWNRKYDGWAPTTAGSRFAAAGLLPFVSLDFHTSRQFCPLSMTVELEGAVTEARVVAELAAGRSRPEFMNIHATRLTEGAGLTVARNAERVRRPLARRARRLLARVRG